MLRLGRLEFGDDDPGQPPAAAALVGRVIDDLVSERLSGGGSSYAIEQLCAAVLADNPLECQSSVDRLLACGVGVDTIYSVYIPRVAARLGEMWADDTLAFGAVTFGMSRLTEIFRRLSPVFLKDRPARPALATGGEALFALNPGESHALGVVMAADYFRRGGWAVRVELKSTVEDLERIVRARSFDLVGLSASCRRAIPALADTVARLRDAADPAALIVVGGQIASLEPGVAELTGADFAVGAAQQALLDVHGATANVGRRQPISA